MSKKCDLISKQNRKEIFYNIINSLLAGFLVFLGACSNGEITKSGILASFIAAGIVAVTKFKEYWEDEKKDYSNLTFSFVS